MPKAFYLKFRKNNLCLLDPLFPHRYQHNAKFNFNHVRDAHTRVKRTACDSSSNVEFITFAYSVCQIQSQQSSIASAPQILVLFKLEKKMISNKSISFTRAIYRNVAHNHRQFAQLLTNHQRTSQFLCANLVRLQSTGIVESAKTVKLHEVPAIAPQVTIIDRLPDVRITRRIVGAVDLDLVLFQYHTCPFCCKVRVFLDSQGISYSVVEVDAVLRQDTKWSSYKKVPMMLAKTKDGKYAQLTDSSAIVSIMTTLLQNPGADVVELAKKYADADEKYQVALSKNAQIKQ